MAKEWVSSYELSKMGVQTDMLGRAIDWGVIPKGARRVRKGERPRWAKECVLRKQALLPLLRGLHKKGVRRMCLSIGGAQQIIVLLSKPELFGSALSAITDDVAPSTVSIVWRKKAQPVRSEEETVSVIYRGGPIEPCMVGEKESAPASAEGEGETAGVQGGG